MSHIRTIRFDPHDPTTVAFLQRIGFTQEEITQGVITGDELTEGQYRFGSFEVLAQLDRSGVEERDEVQRTILSPNECRNGLKLMEYHGEKNVVSLFRQNICPGTATPFVPSDLPDLDELSVQFYASIMLNNLLGRDNSTFFLGAIFPQLNCPYSLDLTLWEQRGVYFADGQVPPAISQLGQAILEVRQGERGGSAVVVSETGDLLSAAHVLYNPKTKKFREPLSLFVNGQEISLTEKDVIDVDHPNDLVLFQRPELAGHPFIKPTNKKPEVGSQVWAIGFPSVVSGEEGSHRIRFYTTGKATIDKSAFFPKGEAPSSAFYTDAQSYGGFSGGAYIDTEGNLVGIVSQSFRSNFGGFGGSSIFDVAAVPTQPILDKLKPIR